jgi:hypothetical protein
MINTSTLADHSSTIFIEKIIKRNNSFGWSGHWYFASRRLSPDVLN